MKTIFEEVRIKELINRVDQVDESAQALWGKMNLKQMLKHCIENEKLLLREKIFKDVFIGCFFGQFALRSDVKNDKPFGKNSPTHPDLKMTVEIEESLDSLKKEWKSLLQKYIGITEDHYSDFKHPFFRTMNYEQVGIWASKHVDHHLRQFGL